MRFSPTELETYRQVVYSNMIDGLREIINVLEDFELELDPANMVSLIPLSSTVIRGCSDLGSGSCKIPQGEPRHQRRGPISL